MRRIMEKSSILKKTLALDLGTNTGWATNALDDILSGHQTFDGEISGWRYLVFKQWLDARLNELNIEHIVYEETFSADAYAARVLHGFLAILQYVYAERYPDQSTRLTLQKVHPGTLKKFATGNGHAKKEEMLNACKKRFGFIPSNDDEADALWLLEYSKK